MSRLAAAAVATIAILIAAALAPGVRAAGPGDAPSRLLVRTSEWNIVLSRAEIGPGPAIVQMYNQGEDPHNLRIRKQKGGPVRRIAELEPGETGTVELGLREGTRYRLWCSLPGHEQLGMRARLKVRNR